MIEISTEMTSPTRQHFYYSGICNNRNYTLLMETQQESPFKYALSETHSNFTEEQKLVFYCVLFQKTAT